MPRQKPRGHVGAPDTKCWCGETHDPTTDEDIHVMVQVMEDTCIEHFRFCCPICFPDTTKPA